MAENGKRSGIYHFCSGIERSVQQIVDSIVELSGVKASTRWNPDARKVDIPRSVGDYSKARKELGWRPRIEFEDGVKKTIAWYRTQLKSEKAQLA